MQSWQRSALVAGFYVVLTIIMTWPVAGRLTSAVAGEGGDAWQTMWRFEEKAALLRQGFEGSQKFFQEEFLGAGEPRLVNLSVWPWMWLQVSLGQPGAYNVVWMSSFWLAGLGMYFLSRFLIVRFGEEVGVSEAGREWGPILAGVMYMFLPYHVSHAMGHFGAMQIQWLPWILLAGLAWTLRPRVWLSLVLSLLLLFQAWSEHHYALWLLILGLVAVGYWLMYVRQAEQGKLPIFEQANRQSVMISIMVLGLAGLLAVASYWPTVRLAVQSETPLALGQEQTIRFSADIFSFITPSSWHPLWGGLSQTLFGQHYTGNIYESMQFLGLGPLLLLVFFHQHIPRASKKFWLWVIAVFGLIALGPRLHVLGEVLPISLPYALVDSWPVLSSVRAVARAGVMVGLAVAVLFGWVLATQVKRRQSAVLVLGVLVLDFMFVPVPTQSTELSPVYEMVKEAPGSTVVELPAASNYALASRALYASNVHGKEVLNSIALERAADTDEFVLGKQLPAVKQLLYVRTTDLRENRKEFWGQDLVESLPDSLAWVDAAGVIVHTDSMTALQLSAVDRFLTAAGMPRREFADTVWYSRAEATWSGQSDGVLMLRGDGFSHVNYDPERDTTFVRVPRVGEMQLVNVTEETQRVRLSVKVAEENTGQAGFWFGGQRIGQVGVSDLEYTTMELDLPPGEHAVEVRVEGAEALLLQDPLFEVL